MSKYVSNFFPETVPESDCIQVRCITNLHKPIKTVHQEEVVQFFVGIDQDDLPVHLSHALEQTQNFTHTGAVYKRNLPEINNDFFYALFGGDGIETFLESRTMLKSYFTVNVNDPTIILRFNLDVHSHSGKNTVIFQQR